VFSRARWRIDVLTEAAFGAFFLVAPGATIELLEIRPSEEAAALFRLYGVLLITRALGHRAAFGVPDPVEQRRVVQGDVFFAAMTALVLGRAAMAGLTGTAGWTLVALFAAELVWHAAVLAGLRGATRDDLERALERSSRARSARETGRGHAV
jgi:hypothetical protein